MPSIFKTPSGLPLACFIDPSSSGRAALLRTIRANGGGMSIRDSDADVVLIDAESRDARQRARDLCKKSVVLFVEWVEACVSAGRLLGSDVNWGSLRIEDPAIVDESLYTEDDSTQNPPQPPIQTVVKEEMDVKPLLSNSSNLPFSSHSEHPVNTGVPSVTGSKIPITILGMPQPSPSPSEPTPGSSTHASDPAPSPCVATVSTPPNVTETSPGPLFGQLPTDPQLAKIHAIACEQWNAIKRRSSLPSAQAQSGQNHTKSTLDDNATVFRRGSLDSLDAVAKPSRIYEPLARRPRNPHEVSGDSTGHNPKRRKISNGLQKGLRSKVPSVLVPAPGAIVYSHSTDDLSTATAFALNTPSASASETLNPINQPVFSFLGQPVQFCLQMDLPDRGSVLRLIKRHGGQLAPTITDATYVIVSKAAPQYSEILRDAEAADRVAVPTAWIQECIKMNKLAPVDDFVIRAPADPGSQQPTTGTFRPEDIVSTALDSRPPTPPVPSLEHTSRNLFTAEDQSYLQRYTAWRLFRNPDVSMTALCQEIHRNAPGHPHRSWVEFARRPSTEIERIRGIVEDLVS